MPSATLNRLLVLDERRRLPRACALALATSSLVGRTRIVAEADDALARTANGSADALVVVLGGSGHAATECLALMANCVETTPVIALAFEALDADARHAAAEFADACVDGTLVEPEALAAELIRAVERARSDRRALDVDARYRRLYDNSIAGIFVMTAAGELLSGNPALLDLLGLRNNEDLAGRRFVDDICVDRDIGDELLRMLARDGVVDNAEVVLHASEGQRRTVLMSAVGVLDKRGELDLIEGTLIDVSERKQAQEELTYLAKFDRLTGLANRYLLKEVTGRAVARALRRQRSVALLMLDLDRFKEVNDSLGHDTGDALLRAVGARLNGSVRKGDTVARLGGDEFAVLIESVGDAAAEAGAVARNIALRLSEPYSLSGQEVLAPPSIGIATCPEAGMHVDGLLKAADIAMYRAKGEGGGRFVFYTDELHDEVMDRMALEHSVRLAVERREFTLAYQPKIRLADGRIAELEALLRWTSSERGVVGPGTFVPVLERLGLITDVGRWVINKALRQLNAWQKTLDMPELKLSLNLSVRQLAQPELLLTTIRRALAKTGVNPACVEFEVTESMLMRDTERGIQTLQALRDLGVKVSIDDFGTGFSSLQYLRALPLQALKIDRTFIREVPANGNDVAIVRATLAMAKSLGLTVTAEGVERAEQAEFLREAGCDLAQGYYFSRPRPAAELPELLQMDATLLPEHAERQRPDDEERAPGATIRSEPERTVRMRLPFAASSRSRH